MHYTDFQQRQLDQKSGEELDRLTKRYDYLQNPRLYRDGDMWCAVGPWFRDLATSKAGFGATKPGAVANLNRLLHYRVKKRPVDDFEVGGFCRQCKDWVKEEAVMEICQDPDCPCK